ncbi:MAG: cysteine synthase A [Ruminococcaceae bacterium]|nr:cysteine synthase A [Oscillospiraceae bacterium]
MILTFNSSKETIGETPSIELKNIEKEFGLDAVLVAKVEGMNPAGSAKDRAALYMLEDAEKSGIIREGGTIIEATSGNTGIGLASVAVPKGYRVIIVMPENMSEERKTLMSAYGAELVLTSARMGMAGSIRKANELYQSIENSFIPDQFSNPANALAHYETTGPELWRDCDESVDIFVCGVGTGGTISGVGRYLKEQNENIKIIAVEPKSSPVLSEGRSGPHGIQGIGAGFVPKLLDQSVIDEIVTVDEQEAFEAGRMLAKKEGILAGISSGAALHAAIEIAKREESKGKTIVVLLPDRGDRYLSTELFK